MNANENRTETRTKGTWVQWLSAGVLAAGLFGGSLLALEATSPATAAIPTGPEVAWHWHYHYHYSYHYHWWHRG